MDNSQKFAVRIAEGIPFTHKGDEDQTETMGRGIGSTWSAALVVIERDSSTGIKSAVVRLQFPIGMNNRSDVELIERFLRGFSFAIDSFKEKV